MSRIMGIDPGLAVTGIAVVDGARLVYRGNVKTPTTDSDDKRGAFICSTVAKLISELAPAAVWIEDYEYQGEARTNNTTNVRMHVLLRALGMAAVSVSKAPVQFVKRNTWRRYVAKTDDALKAILARMTGLQPKNNHERDAAAVALYGQRFDAAERLRKAQ